MSANDEKQVGGDHYRTHGAKFQHWDLATMFHLDYFQGQITKYVLRWKDKMPTHEERLEDLKKARQFLDKYIEDADQWDTKSAVSTSSQDEDKRRVLAGRHILAEGAPGEWLCSHCISVTVGTSRLEAILNHRAAIDRVMRDGNSMFEFTVE
jgi:hypothetical protein